MWSHLLISEKALVSPWKDRSKHLYQYAAARKFTSNLGNIFLKTTLCGVFYLFDSKIIFHLRQIIADVRKFIIFVKIYPTPSFGIQGDYLCIGKQKNKRIWLYMYLSVMFGYST